MKILRFEDIDAWKNARALTNEIYQLSKAVNHKNHDFRFWSQITSASASIMSNIAEGFSRQTNKEFIQYLFIAKGSTAEVQSLLYIAKDANYITNQDFQKFYRHTDITARLISNFITYLKKHTQPYKHNKHTTQ
ncbi:MAG: four helix bundle protein [Candidatus Omnitrophota bacterium]